MRLRYVVQRYGPDIAGGAEQFCRSLASRMVEAGHQVEVVTTSCSDYLTWVPDLESGTSTDQGVVVIRLDPAFSRDPAIFSRLDERVAFSGRSVSTVAQSDWLLLQGPALPGLAGALSKPTDLTIFFTYLYATTATGIRMASPNSPVLVHPTAHHEAQFHLPLYDHIFHHADAFAFSTPEEAQLVRARSRTNVRGDVIGIGIDPLVAGGNPAAAGVSTDRPYLAVVGRADPAKGTPELVRRFVAMKERIDSPLSLVVVGRASADLPNHRDVVYTGWLDQATKDAIIAGAKALVQPSRQESFSLVMAESWMAGIPTICHEGCAVTTGQTRRSGGGLTYADQASFESSVNLLTERPDIASKLGESGRRWVEKNYAWTTVLSRYETLIDKTIELSRRRDLG